MGFGRWYNAQKTGAQIAVAGGIVAVVGGVVTGVFAIVDAERAKPGAQTSTSAPAPALTKPASALVTSSPPATAASTPPAAAAPTGTITGPRNGATNVSSNEQLRVSGARCACQAQPRTSRRDTASMCFCSSPATRASCDALGGRNWFRTSDLSLVRRVLYH
jgi:hypothetical protein